MIRNRDTYSHGIEDPAFRAGKTNLVVPVPSSAARVGGGSVVGGGEDALTIDKVIAFEASSAVTFFVVFRTLVRDGNTNSISIEDPVGRARKANLIVPIPSGTTQIRRSSVVGGGEDALAVNKVIALEASGAVTFFIMSSTLVRDGDADTVGVEGVFFRASQTDLVIPVPGGTADIRGFSVIEC